MKNLTELINLMPGYISVIDLEGKYLAFNNNLKQLMKIDNPIGMKAGFECKQQIKRIEDLIKSSIGTVVNWEYQHDAEMLNPVTKLNIFRGTTPKKLHFQRSQIIFLNQ